VEAVTEAGSDRQGRSGSHKEPTPRHAGGNEVVSKSQRCTGASRHPHRSAPARAAGRIPSPARLQRRRGETSVVRAPPPP